MTAELLKTTLIGKVISSLKVKLEKENHTEHAALRDEVDKLLSAWKEVFR